VGDATQLHHVLMNLCVNARDAMPSGGQLTVTAENVLLDETYCRMRPGAKPGRNVAITIKDTGMGIPSEIIDKIFDPFFTTKEADKGTGLGLFSVQGIVKNHGGYIDVQSKPGKGAEFRVVLPATKAGQVPQTELELTELPAGHGEVILVVEDEESILEINRAVLEAFGYKALTASDGAEGVAVYTAHQKDIRVVVSDVEMPYLSGPNMIRALEKINPNINIIVTSGLAAGDEILDLPGVKKFLPKPYTAEILLRAIAEILRATSKPTA
jgi:CheY-like chemotaxis protein